MAEPLKPRRPGGPPPPVPSRAPVPSPKQPAASRPAKPAPPAARPAVRRPAAAKTDGSAPAAAPAGKNKMVLIGAAAGGVLLLVVLAAVMMSGNDKPKKIEREETAAPPPPVVKPVAAVAPKPAPKVEPSKTEIDDDFKKAIQDETGIKPEWAAEAFPDVEEDVRQSLRRIEASPFVTKHESLRGFVFDVATGQLNEVTL